MRSGKNTEKNLNRKTKFRAERKKNKIIFFQQNTQKKLMKGKVRS